jgi:hypothetical protein
MLFFALWVASIGTPTSADVQAAEEVRVAEPRTSYSRDGRAYISFAPTVETRNAMCAPAATDVFECRYETRLREAFDKEFGPWEVRVQRLKLREGRWCWVPSTD